MKKQIIELPVTEMVRNGMVKKDLSEREIEVFNQVAKGLSNKQIAEKLNLSDDTIDTHNRSIVSKLNAKNMKEAIAIGIRNKIIE